MQCAITTYLYWILCFITRHSACAGTQPAHCLFAAHIHGLQCSGLCSGGSAVDLDRPGAQQRHSVAAQGHILCFHCPRVHLRGHWLPAVWRQAISNAQKVMAVFTIPRVVCATSPRPYAFTLCSPAGARSWQQLTVADVQIPSGRERSCLHNGQCRLHGGEFYTCGMTLLCAVDSL